MENTPQESSEPHVAAETPALPEEAGAQEPVPVKAGARWREMLRQALEKARQTQPPVSTRRDLSKDRSKSMLLLAGAAALMLLLFFGLFSSPQRARKLDAGRRPGTPDLGRRATPGQETAPPGSVTPMLNADVSGGQALNTGDVTPEDVDRTSRLGFTPGQAPKPAVPPAQSAQPERDPGQYSLSKVDFSDPDLAQQSGYGVGPAYQPPPVPAQPATSAESDDLRKPSLVFVRAAEANAAGGPAARPAVIEQTQVLNALPPGTRLVARLESAVNSAVKEPVVAVIEYNYERDGEIVVPAGTKAIGQLQQADRSGYVDIRFETLEIPDGTALKMNGIATDLRLQPLKGTVAGKKTGTKLLVRAFTGLGTMAAYLVGNSGGSGLYGPISESALLRERVANNIGMAGDEQLNELAFNQNIVVTVPGNTRFYIVLDAGGLERAGAGAPTANSNSKVAAGPALPSLEELRQLMQLKQELGAMYQQASTPAAGSQVTPQ